MAAQIAAAVAAAEQKVDSALAKVKWTEEERTKYCEEMPEHPMFRQMSEQEIEKNDIAQAVRKAEYDELDTPEALAHECKEKGNAAFQRGENFHGMAIKHYLDAIQHARMVEEPRPKPIRQLESTCQGNLAAIWLHRKKYITCLEACAAALKLWPDNVKAAFRAAKAALVLGRAAAALEFCEVGLTIEPENAAFGPVMKEARALLSAQEANQAAVEKAANERAQQLQLVRQACIERGIKVGPPLYSGMKRTSADPYVDESDTVHWPVLLLYPQFGTSDYVEDWPEVSTVGELLEMILPDDGPRQPWDGRGEYVASNCDIFYKSYPCKPLPDIQSAWTQAAADKEPEETWKDVKWVRVPAASPLLLPLVQDSYCVADVPVLYVVARSSTFYASMKAGAQGGTFVTLKVPELPPSPTE